MAGPGAAQTTASDNAAYDVEDLAIAGVDLTDEEMHTLTKLRIGAAPFSYHVSCTRSSLTWSLPTHYSPDRLVSRNFELHNGCGRPPSLELAILFAAGGWWETLFPIETE
jgi:hypothetical protein